MNDIDIPILKKSYELYKKLHEFRRLVPKQDRFTLYEQSEKTLLSILECIVEAGSAKNPNKAVILEKASVKLNILRLFVRLMKETRVLDSKKYVILQEMIDEIGRMLGGWIRSTTVR